MKPISNHTGQYFRQIPKNSYLSSCVLKLNNHTWKAHGELEPLAQKICRAERKKFIVRDKNVNQEAMVELGQNYTLNNMRNVIVKS